MDILIGVLGAGIGAGLMSLIQSIMKRKWEKEDKDADKQDQYDELTERLGQIETKIATLSEEVGHVKMADQAILSDRIKWLGTKYLEEGEIEFEDRRILHQLHNAYHNHCGGNGDFDILMQDIDALPLKRG